MTTPEQKGITWIRAATPEQIRDARRDGALDRILRGDNPDHDPLTNEQIAALTPAEILERAKVDPDIARRLPSLGAGVPEAGADQGARGEKQTMRERLRGMSPEQVRDLHRSGALDSLLAGNHAPHDYE